MLLKNSEVLPLDGAKVRSIAVIGAHADVGIMSGGGSAQVDAPGGNAIDPQTPTQWGKAVYFPSAPLRYIREHAPFATVRFDAGKDPASAAALAKDSEVAIVFADQYMSEGGDAPTLTLPGRQNELIAAVAAANNRTVVVLITGNPVKACRGSNRSRACWKLGIQELAGARPLPICCLGRCHRRRNCR